MLTRPSTTGVDDLVVAGGALIGRVVPNPVLGVSSIDVTLPSTMRMTISLIDVTGSQVMTIIDGISPAGGHHFIIDSSILASGLYHVVTIVNGVPSMQPVIIVK